MTRYTGIEFADKAGSCQYLKKDGKWLTSKITFLGSTWDLTNNTLCNERFPEGLPIFGLSDDKLKRIVGKTYGELDKQFER